MAEILILVFETIGTIAFALTGGLVAIERQLDIFGVLVMSLTTAVGGGIIRDLILGNTPPVIFRNPYYVIVAFLTFLVLMAFMYLFKSLKDLSFLNYMKIVNISDAMGLGIFSVLGAKTAIDVGFGENAFLCVFVGVITGIGGGIIRDIMVCRIPIVLRREIYAISSIIGTVLFFYLRLILPETIAVFISAGLICILRIISTKLKLTLPVTSMIKD